MGFQTQVYINPAQGLPGDFASSNPMIYKLSGSGKMVADASGVTVGKFAVLNADGTVSTAPGVAPSSPSRIGFVHREMNAQIVTYLADSGYTIYPGEPVALFGSGDFFVAPDVVVSTPSRGAAVFYDYATGHVVIGGSASGSIVATNFVMISESTTVGSTTIISSTGA